MIQPLQNVTKSICPFIWSLLNAENKIKKDLDKYFETQPKVRPIFRFLAMWDKFFWKKRSFSFSGKSMWLAENQLSKILRSVFKCLQYFTFISFVCCIASKEKILSKAWKFWFIVFHINSLQNSTLTFLLFWEFLLYLYISFHCPWICIKRLKKMSKPLSHNLSHLI